MDKFGFVLLLMVMLSACSLAPEKPPQEYRLADQQHWQQQDSWRFAGRLALVDERDSISASVTWQHKSLSDYIELVGPLAQGRLAISVTAGKVAVDDGDQRQEYLGDADRVLVDQLGVDMPVEALKYWMLGISDPRYSYTDQPGGFYQRGWLVRFKEMQSVSEGWLPKRITVEKDKTRIKLIVDQWDIP